MRVRYRALKWPLAERRRWAASQLPILVPLSATAEAASRVDNHFADKGQAGHKRAGIYEITASALEPYDAYYYRVPKGQEHLWDGKKEFNLGRSLSEAAVEWARRVHRIEHDATVDAPLERTDLGEQQEEFTNDSFDAVVERSAGAGASWLRCHRLPYRTTRAGRLLMNR